MGSITTIALSGLRASEVRLANAAANIANAQSEDFTPKDVVQKQQAGSGVQVSLRDRPDAAGSGFLPAVDLSSELVDSLRAEQAYKAGAALVKTDRELQDSLLAALEKDED